MYGLSGPWSGSKVREILVDDQSIVLNGLFTFITDLLLLYMRTQSKLEGPIMSLHVHASLISWRPLPMHGASPKSCEDAII